MLNQVDYVAYYRLNYGSTWQLVAYIYDSIVLFLEKFFLRAELDRKKNMDQGGLYRTVQVEIHGSTMYSNHI